MSFLGVSIFPRDADVFSLLCMKGLRNFSPVVIPDDATRRSGISYYGAPGIETPREIPGSRASRARPGMTSWDREGWIASSASPPRNDGESLV